MKQAEERLEGSIDRGNAVLNHIEALLEAVDPRLVTGQALNPMVEPLGTASEALAGLEEDIERVATFDGALENALAGSHQLAALVAVPSDLEESITKNFGTALRGKAKDLSKEAEAIGERLEALASEQTRLEQESKEAAEQRRLELQGEIDRITEAIKTEQSRLDQLVPQFEQQFGSAQETRVEDWQTLRKSLEEKVAEAQTQLQDRANTTASSLEEEASATAQWLKEQADEVLVEVREKRDEVVKLYGLIGDTGTAGAFAKEADHQREQANRWRVIAVLSAIATIVLALGAVIFSAIDAGGNVASHLASLVVAAAAGGLTAYAAKQSGHHRDREDESRRIELELTAFGPFTKDLSDPSAARADYAVRLFKGAEREDGGEPKIGKDQVSLLQTIVETLVKTRG